MCCFYFALWVNTNFAKVLRNTRLLNFFTSHLPVILRAVKSRKPTCVEPGLSIVCIHITVDMCPRPKIFSSEFYPLFMEIPLPSIIGSLKWLDLVILRREQVYSLTALLNLPSRWVFPSWVSVVAFLFPCPVVESPFNYYY